MIVGLCMDPFTSGAYMRFDTYENIVIDKQHFEKHLAECVAIVGF